MAKNQELCRLVKGSVLPLTGSKQLITLLGFEPVTYINDVHVLWNEIRQPYYFSGVAKGADKRSGLGMLFLLTNN